MYKGKIINFELLHIDDYSVLFDELCLAKTEGHDAIIGLLLMDGFLYKNSNEFFENMRALQTKAVDLGFKKIVLVPGMCENFKKQLEDNNIWFDVVHFDFWQSIVYQSYKHLEVHSWNRHTDRFLFLGGIPSRFNRISLLSKLYDKGLLERGEWTFFQPWTDEDKDWCRKTLNHYNDNEYHSFISNTERKIDNLYSEAKHYSKASLDNLKDCFDNDWCKDPSYINPNIFKSTSVSVISEGLAYDPASDFRYLTEKTWRTIYNKHPFIMAGYTEQSEYARQRGLRTFNQYCIVPEYDLIEDVDQRLNAIVQNVEYFLNNIDRYAEQINNDIEYNYKLFNDVTNYNQSVLETFRYDYQISDADIDKWFNQKSFLHLMRVLNEQ